MNLANKLTFFRIILAPVFFVVYFIPQLFGSRGGWTIPVLLILFIVSELTDYFDGLAARKLNLTSDFGKLFDPFADTVVQITFFLCFLIGEVWGGGLLPVILFLIILYRELFILFLRNLMLKKGVTLGARIGGKIKTVAYIVALSVALLAVCFERLSPQENFLYETFLPYLRIGALVIFIISVIISVASFIDYLIVYRKTGNAE